MQSAISGMSALEIEESERKQEMNRNRIIRTTNVDTFLNEEMEEELED